MKKDMSRYEAWYYLPEYSDDTRLFFNDCDFGSECLHCPTAFEQYIGGVMILVGVA